MPETSEQKLSAAEEADFRRLAGMMIPASPEYRVPGADDPLIFADIVRSIGRDFAAVRKALAQLRELARGDFAKLDDAKAQAIATEFLARRGPLVNAVGRSVLQCYYRDDRVVSSLGLALDPPFPKGRKLEQGDWSLLEPVKQRARMWRDVDAGGR
ncbi:MAG: hypothetical protein JSS20_16725 [Proteobacteria bacterium]|nr:hypothetical protein [Pseudomonadota bacterium]